MGFGMTTVLLNIHNTGLFPVSAMILGMGIFYGGLAQIIAGIMEFKKGNTFGTTAFTSYGLFWISLVALWLLPSLTFISAG
jgi:succinate-acetate transporter protein